VSAQLLALNWRQNAALADEFEAVAGLDRRKN
jgi:hypothetical protein